MPALWKKRWNGIDREMREMSFQNIPPIVQHLLWNRGFTDSEKWDRLFSPRLADLHSPWLMKDMNVAVDRLVHAHETGEKICLYADFDLDGTSGLALAIQGFQELGFKSILPVQPLRLTDGYGFHSSIVETLAAKDVKVIVTIDVGITALAACERARELGMDVVVTDHHQPSETLPPALAVVNPNRRDCDSGLGYLCGAGVIFYLLRALKRRLVESSRISENDLSLRSLLDLLTIATLTDMVPLVADNRALIKHGLQVLSETRRPGLRALLEKLRLADRPLSAQDVAIRFAPKLNALSRLETGLRPLDIYMAPTMEDAYGLVEQVLRQNTERVELQGRGEEIALRMAEDFPFERFVYVSSPEFHRGVVGLIATRLAAVLGRPAFVGSESGEGVVVGSARSPQGSGISVLKALTQASESLSRFGGHPPAAGFELHKDSEGSFIRILDHHFGQAEVWADPEIEYDLDLPLEAVSPGLIRWLETLGPYGTHFPVPLFAFQNLTLETVKNLKGGHLRLEVLGPRLSKPISALYFSPPASLNLSPGQRVSLLGELQKNDFRRIVEPQILIRDLRTGL